MPVSESIAHPTPRGVSQIYSCIANSEICLCKISGYNCNLWQCTHWILQLLLMQVENFLLHFWQGMPNHLLPVLGSDTVIDLVAICDSTLYKAVSNVFISSPLQMIPEK